MRVLGGLLVGLLLGSGLLAQEPPAHQVDKRCLDCHGQKRIATLDPAERASMVGTWLGPGSSPGKSPSRKPGLPSEEAKRPSRPSLHVLPDALQTSVHAELACVQCHKDAQNLPHEARLDLATCASSCHEKAVEAYEEGAHGKALRENDERAPTCVICHGGHDIRKVEDKASRVHRTSRAFLCGDCHANHAPRSGDRVDPKTLCKDYLESTHGAAMKTGGLIAAAICSDCHGSHAVFPAKDERSRAHRDNIPETCGNCHVGINDDYAKSIHGKLLKEGDERAPICTDCHTAHRITRTSTPAFMLDIVAECGNCHNDPEFSKDRLHTRVQTYHRSYHGQMTQLGSTRAARCSDCHGSHEILPSTDPTSLVHPDNLIQTCAQTGCHPKANQNFISFDPHADIHDFANYPVLWGVWLYFMIVMSGAFGVFGIHTVLWFIRSWIDRARTGEVHVFKRKGTAIRRFSRMQRINHVLVAIPFLGLTGTGIPLFFADREWASGLAWLFGGIEMAGFWHRFFAIFLLFNFLLHFVGIGRSIRNRKGSFWQWLFGPTSMLPKKRDVSDFLGMFRWFFRGGKMPKFDRWTYFEKFDYWCEIGGSVIIGSTGLMLWFPEFSAKIMPGWVFNIAMIAHGYEALLAIGFIFTIHFFNANLRPGKFPVDTVIFSGCLPEEELKAERPEEYKRLLATGELEELRVPEWPTWKYRVAIVLGSTAQLMAVTVLVLMILAGFDLL